MVYPKSVVYLSFCIFIHDACFAIWLSLELPVFPQDSKKRALTSLLLFGHSPLPTAITLINLDAFYIIDVNTPVWASTETLGNGYHIILIVISNTQVKIITNNWLSPALFSWLAHSSIVYIILRQTYTIVIGMVPSIMTNFHNYNLFLIFQEVIAYIETLRPEYFEQWTIYNLPNRTEILTKFMFSFHQLLLTEAYILLTHQ